MFLFETTLTEKVSDFDVFKHYLHWTGITLTSLAVNSEDVKVNTVNYSDNVPLPVFSEDVVVSRVNNRDSTSWLQIQM